MTEEQQFKTKALSQGMEALKAEYRNRMDRETDSYHQAVFQLLLNVDETWRAKNEKSWFDKINSDGYSTVSVGKTKSAMTDQAIFMPKGTGYDGSNTNPYLVDEQLVSGHDNIGGHEVVKSTMVSLLEELETKLVEALQFGAMSMTQIAEIRRKKMKDVSDIKAEIVYVDSFLRKRKLKGVDTDKPVEQWKPETNEWYWKLRDTGVPLELKWTGTKQDWDYYHYGNCFRTNAEAVAARDMVKKALLG
jgi:hypothetical protein